MQPANFSLILYQGDSRQMGVSDLPSDPEMPEQQYIRLRKRVSSADYYDGYVAGLNAAREAINRQIEIAHETKRIAEQLSEKPPA